MSKTARAMRLRLKRPATASMTPPLPLPDRLLERRTRRSRHLGPSSCGSHLDGFRGSALFGLPGRIPRAKHCHEIRPPHAVATPMARETRQRRALCPVPTPADRALPWRARAATSADGSWSSHYHREIPSRRTRSKDAGLHRPRASNGETLPRAQPLAAPAGSGLRPRVRRAVRGVTQPPLSPLGARPHHSPWEPPHRADSPRAFARPGQSRRG